MTYITRFYCSYCGVLCAAKGSKGTVRTIQGAAMGVVSTRPLQYWAVCPDLECRAKQQLDTHVPWMMAK